MRFISTNDGSCIVFMDPLTVEHLQNQVDVLLDTQVDTLCYTVGLPGAYGMANPAGYFRHDVSRDASPPLLSVRVDARVDTGGSSRVVDQSGGTKPGDRHAAYRARCEHPSQGMTLLVALFIAACFFLILEYCSTGVVEYCKICFSITPTLHYSIPHPSRSCCAFLCVLRSMR